jgi:hypothetical protein
MSKTFRYTKFTGHYYCQYSDEWEQDGVEFDYEVEDEDLLPEIVNLLFEDYFESDKNYCDNEKSVKAIKENLKRMVEESELIEVFADQYEETLKEIFEQEAMDFYND